MKFCLKSLECTLNFKILFAQHFKVYFFVVTFHKISETNFRSMVQLFDTCHLIYSVTAILYARLGYKIQNEIENVFEIVLWWTDFEISGIKRKKCGGADHKSSYNCDCTGKNKSNEGSISNASYSCQKRWWSYRRKIGRFRYYNAEVCISYSSKSPFHSFLICELNCYNNLLQSTFSTISWS